MTKFCEHPTRAKINLIGSLVLVTCLVPAAWTFGQDGPVFEPPAQTPVEPPAQQPSAPTNDVGNQNTNGGADQSSGSVTTGDGQVEPQLLELGVIEDVRNQGFVGATAALVDQRGFVGAASETSGPPLADGASFGGGVNGSGGQGGGQQGFGGQGGVGTTGQNGFEVIRRSLRTNTRAHFAAPVVSGQQTTDRFRNRLSRQPQMSSNVGLATVQVSISDRVATLTGFVSTPAQRDQLERQLRLEPGVDRIDNLITVQ